MPRATSCPEGFHQNFNGIFVFSCQNLESFGCDFIQGNNPGDQAFRADTAGLNPGQSQCRIDGIGADHGCLPGDEAEHVQRRPRGENALNDDLFLTPHRGQTVLHGRFDTDCFDGHIHAPARSQFLNPGRGLDRSGFQTSEAPSSSAFLRLYSITSVIYMVETPMALSPSRSMRPTGPAPAIRTFAAPLSPARSRA